MSESKNKSKLEKDKYLTGRGYILRKHKLTPKREATIRKDLTVSPYVDKRYAFGSKVTFKVFLENEAKFYLPRFYALEKFGIPDENYLVNRGEDLNPSAKFNKTLRPHQVPIVDNILDKLQNRGGVILNAPCACGKCCTLNTPILMFDGSIKMVQDVVPGDVLMGDDSTPRNVLSICRGREMMYNIIPKKGDTYRVNESHILSLKCSSNSGGRYKKGDIVDISVTNYLKLPPSYHSRAGTLLGYRVSIEFSEKEVPIDPYLFGYWLGDGTQYTSEITTQSAEVIKYIVDLFKYKDKRFYLLFRSNYHYHIQNAGKERINHFVKFLKSFNLFKKTGKDSVQKYIPLLYKCNSRQVRLELLAGIIDSDGSCERGAYDIIQKNEKLLDDIIFLARSLGFAAYKKECQKSCIYKGEKLEETCYRTNIHGKGLEEIPVKCPWKKVEKRRQIKDVLVTRIKVEKDKVDNYYGFVLDGNHRYVMGDFTVTHNTAMSIKIIEQIGKRALVVVHKEFLLNQWVERIQEFMPEAKIGLVQAGKVIIDGCDIILAMLQSISIKSYPPGTFESIGFTVVDECHHTGAEIFSRALAKVSTKYMLGLSATPDRADGLTILLKWFLGEFEIPVSRPKNYTVHVDIVKNPTLYDLQDQLPGGAIRKASMAGMITKLGDDLERNKLLLDKLESVIKDTPNRKVIILSDRREHLTYLHKQITTRTNMKKENSSLSGMTCGMYIGGMKKQDLKESEDCDIIVSTYSMTSEGFDIPSLNTLFLSTPKSNIEQSVGRILRKSSEINPLVVDTYDNHELLEGMYRKRIRFYKKNGYAIDYGDNRPGGRVFQGGVNIKTTKISGDKQKNTLDKYAFNDDY